MFESKSIKKSKMHFKLGFTNQIQGNLDIARENYLESIGLHPTAEAFVNLGWSFCQEENYEEAIKQCHKALMVDSNFGMAYTDIGYYMLRLDKTDEAIAWLEEAIAIKEFDGKFYSYYNLGRAYEAKGMWQKGIEMYDKSISEKPNFKLGKKKLLFLSSRLN